MNDSCDYKRLERAHVESGAHMMQKSPRAEELISCLEGEIAKRDEELAACRVAVENCEVFRARIVELERNRDKILEERDAIAGGAEFWHDGKPPHPYGSEWFIARLKDGSKAVLRELPEEFSHDYKTADNTYYTADWIIRWAQFPDSAYLLYAAPVSEAKAQGEYGDAYQGAREDLAIWKRRALEAEKALQEERIITERLGNALNEENGPTFMGEPVFPAKAKGVVMPTVGQAMRVVLREIGSSTHVRGTSNWCADVGRAVLDEVARLNVAPAQQVSVQSVCQECNGEGTDRSSYVPLKNRDLDDCKACGGTGRLAAAPAAPAAPAADLGHVFYGMDGNHP